MWAMPVVMIDVLGEDPFKLTSMEDQHPVETPPTDRADEALSECIGPRRSDRCADDPNSLGSEDLIETGRELGIPVTHQKSDGMSTIDERHRQVAGLLDHPRSSRVGGDPVYIDASACRAR